MKAEETILKEIANTRHFYDDIEVPEELGERIQWVLTQNESKEETKRMEKNSLIGKWVGVAAALMVAVFVFSLNTSKSFAAVMENVPFLGGISRVLTFRSYEEDPDKTVSIEAPQIQEKEEEPERFVADINAEIERLVTAYKTDAEQHISDYKAAFLATGGTEEEFAKKNIKVDVSYEVKYESDTVLSLVLTANENWSSAYGVQYFYNLDLEKQKNLTLADLLGSGWIDKANSQMKAQMAERMAANEYLTYWEDFAGVDETTHFYLSEAGNPVVVFAKYEVAPGAAGIQEFELTK